MTKAESPLWVLHKPMRAKKELTFPIVLR
jgi:hypothetical protein